MRVIYVDESGHSNNEKIAMVAGVILDPDRKWRLLDGAIQALKAEVPEQYRDNFVFHATDLEGGGRYRAEWPDEERWALLNKLLELPRQHQVPIVFGFFEKPDVVQTIRGHARSLVVHALSFAMCLKAVDSYMENEASGELAMLVAEQREEARRAIEETQRMMQHRQAKDFLPALLTKPISHIKSTPSFATKQDEPLLQLADACAFALH